MLPMGRGGLAMLEAGPAFARPSEPVIGNGPPWTGSPGNTPAVPGPHPSTQPLGGQVGRNDGTSGSDPAAAQLQPHPHVSFLGEGQESDRRYGITGFNDQLQIRDRHVYWDRGRQRFGWTASVPGNPPNPHSDGPAMPALRAVNRSVNPQIGSSATAAQDDLTRPYTWLGQQDGALSPVYGGVPGLWQAYGNRGLPAGIHDPSDGQGGPQQVAPGPPHGLHSATLPDGQQILERYKSTPQMRPVRQDRPANSPIAGQSYSQTVLAQGAQPSGRAGTGQRTGLALNISGRGWAGS